MSSIFIQSYGDGEIRKCNCRNKTKYDYVVNGEIVGTYPSIQELTQAHGTQEPTIQSFSVEQPIEPTGASVDSDESTLSVTRSSTTRKKRTKKQEEPDPEQAAS